LHAQTPTTVPGGRVIRTLELKRLLDAGAPLAIVDVLDSQTRFSEPGAFWVPDGGKAFAGTAERGDKDVLWYRGGTNTWLGANLENARAKPVP